MLTDIRALADHFLIALPNINSCINIGGDRMESARQRYNLGHFHFTSHMCVEKITTDGVSTFGAFEKMKRIFSIAPVGILEKLWESPDDGLRGTGRYTMCLVRSRFQALLTLSTERGLDPVHASDVA